ncbi:hypothetical protein [Bradyrhizobium sp. CCGUVB23]|uniref:hypothetical protein n=1 Tax=Bradyrhizobium sp. CCGUVB23 TaxID=2949630 RepID=UPI0020B3440E|nr:hypothetical protein [Bradyrhizobium sp. CCGUVB23]MCP3460421.1 hypothetical protein [Bradyrhizobium sp. CCGUVB23]
MNIGLVTIAALLRAIGIWSEMFARSSFAIRQPNLATFSSFVDLPYDDVDLLKIKLAMKVGGEYKLSQIGLRRWQKFAHETRVDSDKLIANLIAMAEQIPDLVTEIRARTRGIGQRRHRAFGEFIKRASKGLRTPSKWNVNAPSHRVPWAALGPWPG